MGFNGNGKDIVICIHLNNNVVIPGWKEALVFTTILLLNNFKNHSIIIKFSLVNTFFYILSIPRQSCKSPNFQCRCKAVFINFKN